jgi:leucyl-tRNA synthetase
MIPVDATENSVMEQALKLEDVDKWLVGKQVVKVIFVPNKLINIVIA